MKTDWMRIFTFEPCHESGVQKVTCRRARELSNETPEALRMLFTPFSRHHLRFGVIATIVGVAACSSSAINPLPSDGKVPLGTWGGDNAGMIVGDTATHLHIGCTFGDVSGRIAVDANGGFDVSGSYVLRAYPVMVGPSLPARFVGRLDGSVATVTVTVIDTVQHATVVKGPVIVLQGEAPRLGPCPICRRPVLTRRGT